MTLTEATMMALQGKLNLTESKTSRKVEWFDNVASSNGNWKEAANEMIEMNLVPEADIADADIEQLADDITSEINDEINNGFGDKSFDYSEVEKASREEIQEYVTNQLKQKLNLTESVDVTVDDDSTVVSTDEETVIIQNNGEEEKEVVEVPVESEETIIPEEVVDDVPMDESKCRKTEVLADTDWKKEVRDYIDADVEQMGTIEFLHSFDGKDEKEVDDKERQYAYDTASQLMNYFKHEGKEYDVTEKELYEFCLASLREQLQYCSDEEAWTAKRESKCRKTESEELPTETIKKIYNQYVEMGMEDSFWDDLVNCTSISTEEVDRWAEMSELDESKCENCVLEYDKKSFDEGLTRYFKNGNKRIESFTTSKVLTDNKTIKIEGVLRTVNKSVKNISLTLTKLHEHKNLAKYRVTSGKGLIVESKIRNNKISLITKTEGKVLKFNFMKDSSK